LIEWLEANSVSPQHAFGLQGPPVVLPPVAGAAVARPDVGARPKLDAPKQTAGEELITFLRRLEAFFRFARVPEADHAAFLMAQARPEVAQCCAERDRDGATPSYATLRRVILRRFGKSPAEYLLLFNQLKPLANELFVGFAHRLFEVYLLFLGLEEPQLSEEQEDIIDKTVIARLFAVVPNHCSAQLQDLFNSNPEVAFTRVAQKADQLCQQQSTTTSRFGQGSGARASTNRGTANQGAAASQGRGNGANRYGQQRPGDPPDTCFTCNQEGHRSAACPTRIGGNASSRR
jgi:hypothetical protein